MHYPCLELPDEFVLGARWKKARNFTYLKMCKLAVSANSFVLLEWGIMWRSATRTRKQWIQGVLQKIIIHSEFKPF
ncbi:MAG: hypothetical protein B0W54_24030 [Cellvibrio sp. 79]|nr:MAG: hypothetical protein B0W54_24030 [Cellvibrio sp. 79]